MNIFFLSTFVTQILNSFSDIFKDKRTFENFKILVVGWILTPEHKTFYKDDPVSKCNLQETS